MFKNNIQKKKFLKDLIKKNIYLTFSSVILDEVKFTKNLIEIQGDIRIIIKLKDYFAYYDKTIFKSTELKLTKELIELIGINNIYFNSDFD